MRQIISLDLKRELTNDQIHGLWSEFQTLYQKDPNQPAYQLYAEGCCDQIWEILVDVDPIEEVATMNLASPH